YPEHMTLSDFRCHFQALSPPIMKRYASMFVNHDERKAVEELLCELDLDKKSIVVGSSRRGVLRYLELQRDQQVSGWLLHLQAACMAHLARQKYRKLKVQQMAISCLQRNLRALWFVSEWSWWKLFCKLRPQLDREQAGDVITEVCFLLQDEITALRRRLQKSERDRNELRQSADSLETTITAVNSELSDERFRGDAVGQALDVERAERVRLSRENKDLQTRCEQCKVNMEAVEKQLEEEKQNVLMAESQRGIRTEGELSMQLEVSQTEAQVDQSRRSVTELKRHGRRVTSDLQDARVLTDSLQGRMHELDRKQRRFDSELTQALEAADSERDQKDKAFLENTESQAEVLRLQKQKEELCAQIRDLSLPVDLASDSLPDLKKQQRLLEAEVSEKREEICTLSAKIQKQQQVHMQLEMQLEQEYEEKQMVIHEKHDLEGLIATLCDQVGHRDFDVEKKLRRDLKRTHALLADAQLLLSTVDNPGQNFSNGSRENIERLHCQLEASEAVRLEAESLQTTLSQELETSREGGLSEETGGRPGGSETS
ncbi:hypothetical protein KUCAC02_037561, partial [Chaenocephalus aceratus]